MVGESTVIEQGERRRWVLQVPNLLSISRLLSAFALLYLFYKEWFVAMTALAFVAMATDALDGWWARKYKAETPFGQKIDPVADRALVFVLGLISCLYGVLPFWWLGLLIAVDVATTVIGFAIILHRRGGAVDLASNMTGRVSRCVQYGLITAALTLSVFAPQILPAAAPLLNAFVYVSAALILISAALNFLYHRARNRVA